MKFDRDRPPLEETAWEMEKEEGGGEVVGSSSDDIFTFILSALVSGSFIYM